MIQLIQLLEDLKCHFANDSQIEKSVGIFIYW